MNNLNEYPLKKSQGNLPSDKVRYEHPSFGILDISRIGSGGDFNLFEDERAKSAFNVTISHADVSQGLGHSWFHSQEKIVNVIMSSNQFSELIMTDNSAVPCTIRFSETEGHHSCSKPLSSTDSLKVEVEGLNEFKTEVHRLKAEIEKILKAKGTMKKADKEKVLELTKELKTYVDNNAEQIKTKTLKAIKIVNQKTQDIIESEVDSAMSKVGKTEYIDSKRQLT